ncbi:MAG: WG repeat-containing protein [Chitinophagaceae bacterium]|nr:WG repeat-containing protein [Chitinophagaceae bacterium]
MKAKTFFAICLMLFTATALQAQQLKSFRDSNGKFGYKDSTGAIIIAPRYDKAFEFSDGLASIRQNGKWGIIDMSGAEIVQPKYSYAGAFHNGIACINMGAKVDGYGNVHGGKWGLIDKTGKEIISPKYDKAYQHFTGDYTITGLNGKYGILDNRGKEIISPKYDMIPNPEELIPGPLQEVWLNNKAGFVELSTGKETVPLIYDDVVPFSEDLAAVNIDGVAQNFRVLGGKWGIVDKSGNVVIPIIYEIPGISVALRFKNGKVLVHKDGLDFCIDKTGKEIK